MRNRLGLGKLLYMEKRYLLVWGNFRNWCLPFGLYDENYTTVHIGLRAARDLMHGMSSSQDIERDILGIL